MTAAELEDMQGLLRSGFRSLPHASFGLYHLGDTVGARRLLGVLLPQVTPAAERDVPVATQVALSASGLRSLGLTEAVVGQFSLEFQEGMSAPARSRFLGDDPTDWTWGSPSMPSVDLFVATYAATEDALSTAVDAVDQAAARCSAESVRRLATVLTETEPFGFRDGISDPYVPELASRAVQSQPPHATPVPMGEFVLGHLNAYGQLSQRPVLPLEADPAATLPRLSPGSDGGNPDGGADLGRNGSYLVLRTLRQDVDGFAAYVATEAAGSGLDPTLLAAKMVGRWPSGAPLSLAPDADDAALALANDFGYHRDDARGLRCPLGAHVRRANPRDSLDPDPGSAASLEITDRHRILRRGRAFGPGSHGEDVGLHFIALNANLGRQFEFVQHTWLNNPKFAGLRDDVDALVAPRTARSVFTVPDEPVRRRYAALPDFVTTLGGAYFFLPGLRALRYLAAPDTPRAGTG